VKEAPVRMLKVQKARLISMKGNSYVNIDINDTTEADHIEINAFIENRSTRSSPGVYE
jgi:hypothetical protein